MGLKQPSLVVLKPPLGGLGVILVKNKDCEYNECELVLIITNASLVILFQMLQII